MKLVVFEDEWTAGFGPLTMLRHVSQLMWGTRTLLESIRQSAADVSELILWGREELRDSARESDKVAYNEPADRSTTFVNGRARPGRALLSLTARSAPFAAFTGGQLVAAKLDGSHLAPGVLTKRGVAKASKGVDRLDAPPGSLLQGYWDLVGSNGLAIAEQNRHFEDSLALPPSVEVRGPPSNLRIDAGAEVESHVTFDARLGPVVVEAGVSIESFSRITGPCYLGAKTKVYSALIGGGTSVFDGCKVGGQIENSIIMPHTNKAHHGYVGDSYVGEWVNLGAGSTFSNLKNTYGNVRVDIGGKKVDSGMLKLGPAVGDMCKVSIGALVYSGRFLGTGSHIAGLAATNIPSFTYSPSSSSMVELRIDSVVETQRRMMERRGMTLTRAAEALIRRVFKSTAPERKKAKVRRGRIA